MSTIAGLTGEVRVGEVGAAFADLVADELTRRTGEPFRLGCSGGGSGATCFGALAERKDVDFSRFEIYFADERCVDPESPDANLQNVKTSFGPRFSEVATCHPMSCDVGPAAYQELLEQVGPLDLLQLGLGPDGHTASLFPGSSALDAAGDTLVTMNTDPTGRNPHERMTLTYPAIARARLAVFVVTGAEKQAALVAIASGADLPAGRVRVARVIWLVGPEALGSLVVTEDAS